MTAAKVKYLKTTYGTVILPMAPPNKWRLWVTAHPTEDKSRQFTVPIDINAVEGGVAAINEYFGLDNAKSNNNG